MIETLGSGTGKGGIRVNRPSDNLPEASGADKTAAVLTVSSLNENRSRLRGILQSRNLTVIEAGGVRDAARHISRKRVFAVLCDTELTDGTFRMLLHAADRKPRSPLIIVTSRNADEQLWGEVINLGGYDVLAQPLDEDEVSRVVEMALLKWDEPDKRLSTTSAAKGVAVGGIVANAATA